MRDKYIEERFPRYYKLATHPDGRVDVGTTDNEVEITLAPDDAERLIANHNAVVDALSKMAMAFDEADTDAFTDFWYGPDR